MLFPYDPAEFWEQLRTIVREEMESRDAARQNGEGPVPGLLLKPLYKIAEVCRIFSVTRPTVYEWIRLGKLRPRKIRSRVFFLREEVDALIRGDGGANVYSL